jgi:hypothetical protein
VGPKLLQNREFIQTMKERKLAPIARFLEDRLDRHSLTYGEQQANAFGEEE